MKLAHILVCHSVDPTRAIESIPHVEGALWYVFLHSAAPEVERAVISLMSAREGNIFPYRQNRGLAKSWNDALHLAFESGCDAALLLNDDVVFCEGGYYDFLYTIRSVRNISDNVSYITLHGLEGANSSQAGQIIPQQFACCAITPDAIRKIGYFDENFSPAYYEDVDFDWRAYLSGMTVHVDPRNLVTHERKSTIRNMSDADRLDLDRQTTANTKYFKKKWGTIGIYQDQTYHLPFNRSDSSLVIPFALRASPYKEGASESGE